MVETQVYGTAKRLFLMTIGGGKSTHLTLGNDETLCGREGQYNEMRGEFCTTCHKVADGMPKAADQAVCETPADAGKIADAITDTDKEENTMAEKTAVDVDHNRIVEEVNANIERAKSLAEQDNAEGLEELNTETETLISRLPARGKNAEGAAWSGVKKDLRAAFKAAATVQEKPAAKKAVAKKEEAAPVKTFDQYEGVMDLVLSGAEKVVTYVRDHVKTAVTAKELADVGLKMWLRMPNKDGDPDIIGDSDQAKASSKELKRVAGEAMGKDGGLDAYDVDKAIKALWRAVQNQRTDVRAEYLRSLDDDTEEAAVERERFANVLKDKPEDVPASVWVAGKYGVNLKGNTELARERYAAKMAALEAATSDGASGELEGASEGDDETTETQTPDERVKAAVAKIMRDLSHTNPEDFENASEEAKEAVRADLERAHKALKDMYAAVL